MNGMNEMERDEAMKTHLEQERREGQEGVALIVVLGFLSILLVMGMTFMLNARTERIVSDYSLEAIKSRQLMRTALAAAENDYSRELWKKQLYIPNEELSVFASRATGKETVSGEATLYDSNIELMTGEAADWIPAKYRTNAVSNDVEDAEWILVREESGRILGRYAYVCFDSSGCLDANFIAREEGVANEDGRSITNRTRFSVREVPMQLLPDTADASEFKSQRKGWKGFDSLQTLVLLTDGSPNDGTESKTGARWQDERKEYGVGLASNKVSELNCYSLNAYRGGRYSRGTGKWTQPKFIEPDTGDGAAEALSQFANIKVDKSVFQKQMEDFVSESAWPQDTDYPSVKNVPMINEVILKDLTLNEPKKHDGGDSGADWYEYSGEVTVQVEFWYPFPSEDNKCKETFKISAPSLSIGTKRESTKDIQLLVGMAGGDSGQNYSVSSTCTPEEAEKDVEAKWNGGKPYGVSFKYDIKFENLTGENITDGKLKLLWRGGWRVGPDGLQLKLGSHVVDKMASGVQCDVNSMTLEQKQKSGSFSVEVFDPRWNHQQSAWQRPDKNDEGTWEDFNSVLDNRSSDQQDDGLLMYCRNGPLASPADIGFFPADKPWRTLDLLTTEGAEFLALTTCDTNMYETIKTGDKAFYTNGTFNINSRNTNAVASIFYMMNCMAIPGTETETIQKWSDPKRGEYKDNWVTEDVARGLATKIVEYTGTEPCMAATDWVKAQQVRSYLKAQQLDKHQRESFVRNTWGCFGVADNLFTVLMIAQSIKEGPDSVGKWDDEDMITGERRGVALVWRDPFKTGQNMHHEMMVRMFRFLND